MRGSPWVLEYLYCHQMTTQTYPKGNRLVSGGGGDRFFHGDGIHWEGLSSSGWMWLLV